MVRAETIRIAVFLAAAGLVSTARPQLDKTGTMWAPYVEWSLPNASVEGNPYDVEATATFEHQGSGESVTTGMFYDGEGNYRFRFAGTRTGTWTFATSSGDPELDGKNGTVTITANPNPDIYGFMTDHVGPDGTKWARYRTSLEDKEAFVPQLVMYKDKPRYYHDRPDVVDADIDEFIHGHGFTGFHLKGPPWMNGEEPDTDVFEAVELLLTKTGQAGGVVHIWCYGDGGSRDWGRNTPVDKRFQRYLCARLGPLPNWSMGYGFDTYHIPPEESGEWHRYMHENLGWFHHLGIRPANMGDKGREMSKEELQEWNTPFDYASYQDYQPGYGDYVSFLGFVEGKPLFMEDRFRIRGWNGPGKNYTVEQTRRGLWNSTMAGGSANIWANLTEEDGSYTKGGQSHPYPDAELLNTYSVFFFDNHRFLKDMQRDNDKTDGRCLREAHTHYVFYKENTSSIQMDLSQFTGTLEAVAVDAKKEYEEIPVSVEKGTRTWNAEYSSDWAVAVGDFGSRPVSIAASPSGAAAVAGTGQRCIIRSGSLLRVVGLTTDRTCTVTLTDARGTVSRVRRSAGPRGAVSLSLAGHPRGVYMVKVTSGTQRFCTTVVVP